MHKITELSNGLRIAYECINFVNSVTTGVWIGTGSAMETKNNNGVSHYLEHMFFKGTERFSAKEIAEQIEDLGGQLNAMTSKEYTCIYNKVLSEDIEQALDTLADMLLHSKFSKKDFELERNVILEEINMSEDTPEDLIHDLIAETIWPGHPLGRPIAGTTDSLAKIDRAELMNYYVRQYHPKNTVISVVGNFQESQLLEILEEKFGNWKAKLKYIDSPPPIPIKSNEKILTKDTEQCQLCIGLQGLCRTDEDYYALQIVNSVFGGSMSSRLFQSVRENAGLAYSVYSYSNCYKQDGLFVIYAGLNTDNLENALKLINQEICQLKREYLSVKELAVAKIQLKSALIMGLESMSARMSHLGKNLLLRGSILSSEELMQKIDQVDLTSVSKIIDRIFNFDTLNLAIIGQTKENDYIKLLGF